MILLSDEPAFKPFLSASPEQVKAPIPQSFTDNRPRFMENEKVLSICLLLWVNYQIFNKVRMELLSIPIFLFLQVLLYLPILLSFPLASTISEKVHEKIGDRKKPPVHICSSITLALRPGYSQVILQVEGSRFEPETLDFRL